MQPFELVSTMKPAGDQSEAIEALIKKINHNVKAAVLVELLVMARHLLWLML